MPQQKAKRWQLDCSAKFYPVMSTAKSQSLFGIHAVLSSDVDVDKLAQAANEVAPHYPTVCASVKKGFFWHYLKQNDAPITVCDIPTSPLLPITASQNNGHCFRLCARGKEVRLEVFHAITDGSGALDFLKAILQKYAQLIGEIPPAPITDKSSAIYTEDSFIANAGKTSPDYGSLLGDRPHLNTAMPCKGGYSTDSFCADATRLVAAAKAKGASVTAYLSGMIAYAIESVAKNTRPLAIMVPVNLRQMFNSQTLLNFTLFVRLTFDPKLYETPAEYISAASEQLKQKVNKDAMLRSISTTVKGIRGLSCVPLFIKAFFARLGRLFMRSRQTFILSNLGKVSLDVGGAVTDVRLQMNVSKNNALNMGALSYGDKAYITFTRADEERAIVDAAVSAIGEDMGSKIA